MKKIIFILLIYCIGLAINSCSDEKEEFSGTTTASVDTTAPTVSSISTTTDNQSKISVTDNISVTFSESMDSTSVTTNTSDTNCSGSLQFS